MSWRIDILVELIILLFTVPLYIIDRNDIYLKESRISLNLRECTKYSTSPAEQQTYAKEWGWDCAAQDPGQLASQ